MPARTCRVPTSCRSSHEHRKPIRQALPRLASFSANATKTSNTEALYRTIAHVSLSTTTSEVLMRQITSFLHLPPHWASGSGLGFLENFYPMDFLLPLGMAALLFLRFARLPPLLHGHLYLQFLLHPVPALYGCFTIHGNTALSRLPKPRRFFLLRVLHPIFALRPRPVCLRLHGLHCLRFGSDTLLLRLPHLQRFLLLLFRLHPQRMYLAVHGLAHPELRKRP